jgi:uncharacterized protein with LGFP repeats
VAPVQSPMYAGYAASGYEKGRLGYPVARQICGLVGGGCFQRFQGGIVYYSPASGAHTVGGAIYGVWASRGFEAGALGYPTSEESCGTGAQGCVQQFQKATLAWSPSTGAQYVSGPIGAAWLAAGGPRSTLGQPIGPLICGLVRSGCFQTFQGATAYTSPASGTHAVRGAIFGVWSSRGYERGDLGYPRSDETCSASGCLQSFERWTMFWSPATGPQYVGGAIGSHWRASGGLRAAVGTPVGPEICGLVNGGCFQGFTGGSVYFSPATGAHDVSGAIRDAWAAQGWETGTLGYPLAEPEEVDGGVVQRFEGGTLTLTTATGVVARS